MKLNCSFSSDSTPVLMKTVRLWNWRGSISFLLCVTYGYPNSFAKHILDRAYCIPDPKGNMHNLQRNTSSIFLLQVSLPWASCGCTFFGFNGSALEILVAAAFRFFFFLNTSLDSKMNFIFFSKVFKFLRIQDTLTEIATRRLKKPSQPSMASSHNRPEGTSRATNRTALGIRRETRCVYMQEKPLGFSVIQEKATLGQYICSIPSL